MDRCSRHREHRDFSARIGKIQKAGADPLFLPNAYDEALLQVQHARNTAFEGQSLGSDFRGNPEFLPRCGADCNEPPSPRVISVVIAVRDEPPPGETLLGRLFPDHGATEVLVAATPDTSPATLDAFRSAEASVVVSDAPRGARMKAAALQAGGDVLLFLHADTLLPTGWPNAIARGLKPGVVGGAFRLAFDGGGAPLVFVAAVANLRTTLTRIPYGDQAPFVSRDVYLRIGGHAPWPLLEDVDLFTRLRREGPIALLPETVLTSPRRYERLGITRTVLTNWSVLLAWRLGASPDDAAARYRQLGTLSPRTRRSFFPRRST